MVSELDFFARSTWAGLNDTQVGVTWQRYVQQTPQLSQGCPKVGVGFFWYPSIGGYLRGAKALAPIAKGEKLCQVPVGHLLSEFSVGNSSLHTISEALETEAQAAASQAAAASEAPGRRRARLRLLQPDKRAMMTVLLLRELARSRSPMMPYASIISSHNVDGVPMLWSTDSARWRSASPKLRDMAASARAGVERAYANIVPTAIARFAPELSEGLGCSGARGACDRVQLEQLYSYAAFARLFAILAARDWVLPMYGRSRPFLSPVMDLFNFGQVGIRGKHAPGAQPPWASSACLVRACLVCMLLPDLLPALLPALLLALLPACSDESAVRALAREAHFDDKAHAFVATAAQPIREGTELLFYYGTMCRESWISMYGFAPSEAEPCAERRRPVNTP